MHIGCISPLAALSPRTRQLSGSKTIKSCHGTPPCYKQTHEPRRNWQPVQRNNCDAPPGHARVQGLNYPPASHTASRTVLVRGLRIQNRCMSGSMTRNNLVWPRPGIETKCEFLQMVCKSHEIGHTESSPSHADVVQTLNHEDTKCELL